MVMMTHTTCIGTRSTATQEQWGKSLATSKILMVSERYEENPFVDEGAPTATSATQVKASYGWFSRGWHCEHFLHWRWISTHDFHEY